jgi:hypothetical protein
MEIDEHLKYTLYVTHPAPTLNLTNLSQPPIRPLPTRRRAHGLAQDTRLLLVEQLAYIQEAIGLWRAEHR